MYRKLRVPIDMLAALTSLEAVAQSVQQLGDHRVADAVAQTVDPCALARPPQRRVGIAGGGRLDQRIQIAQQRRVEIIARLRPPPALRVRPPASGSSAVNSRKPRWMVDVAIPVARATSAVPP